MGFRDPLSYQELKEANFVAFQVSGFLPFEFDIIFESQSLREKEEEKGKQLPVVELSGGLFEKTVSGWREKFATKFENKFKLKEKKFSPAAQNMAQFALSNLLGGIGFFTGQSIVKSYNNKEPVLYWPSNLYTAVPSRSFFPRGFLWDEGFHNILISEWDLDISKDIIGHWLDLMNIEGKIGKVLI